MTRPTYEERRRFRALNDATFTARYGNDRARREEGWRLVEDAAATIYGQRRGPFAPGDRVRTTRELYRGELPAGSEGTFVEYRAVPDPYMRSDGPTHQTVGVVDFGPGRRDKVVGLRALTGPFGSHSAPSPTDVSHLRALAAAHRAVDDAYDALANALTSLKDLEAGQ